VSPSEERAFPNAFLAAADGSDDESDVEVFYASRARSASRARARSGAS
jgi:hypothetical protein